MPNLLLIAEVFINSLLHPHRCLSSGTDVKQMGRHEVQTLALTAICIALREAHQLMRRHSGLPYWALLGSTTAHAQMSSITVQVRCSHGALGLSAG